MPFIINKHATTPIPGHSSGNNNDKSTLSLLATKISSASNIPLNMISNENNANEEASLAAILSIGKGLRLQAESPRNDYHTTSVQQGWKCGLLKRCLLGVGILTGSGLLVNSAYRFYSARVQENTERPEPSSDIILQDQNSNGWPGNLFSYQVLHSATSAYNMPSHHHVTEHQPTPLSISVNKQRSKRNIRRKLHKENNTALSTATKKANHRVIKMLRGKILPRTGKISRARLLYAVSIYLFHNKKGIIDNETSVQLLARMILYADKIDAGKSNKSLSFSQAKATIRHWVFLNILGMSPVELIEKKIKESRHSQNYTIANIHKFLSANKFPGGNRPHFFTLSKVEKKMLLTMWKSFLNDELPFLQFYEKSIKNLEISHCDFASLYTGSSFLNTVLGNNFTAEEAISTGRIMWDLAINGEEDNSKLIHYWPPALFYLTAIAPSNTTQNQINNADALNLYIRHRKKIINIQEEIKIKYDQFIIATKKWRSKSTLKNYIESTCLSKQNINPTYQENTFDIQIKEQERHIYFKKDIYPHNNPTSCKYISEHTNDIYNKLTERVAYTFYEMNKYLIMAAIISLPEDEQEFINSPHAIIYSAKIDMKKNSTSWLKYLSLHDNEIIISQNKRTDLVSVNIGREERIYALKAEVNSSHGYQVIRVDREISKYLKNDIFNYDFHNEYIIDKASVLYRGECYFYDIFLEEKMRTDGKSNLYSIVDFLSMKHRKNLYYSLYKTGDVSNDTFDIKNIWDTVKHIIPFYDCVEGIIDSDPVQAIPACLMDAVAFIPVFGTAASLSEKFGMGVIRGLRRGAMSIGREGIESASKNILQEISLPKASEIKSLGKEIVRSIDPGFELITDISSTLGKRILRRMLGNKQTEKIAQKITSTGRLTPLSRLHTDTHIIEQIPEIKTSELTQENRYEKDIYATEDNEIKPYDDEIYPCPLNKAPHPFLSYTKKNNSARKTHTKNNKKDNNIIYAYDRKKRGAINSKPCSVPPSSSINMPPVEAAITGNVIGSGSISTIYDLNNGYVKKTYNGILNERYKSRLTSANNNAKGFNRYYGAGSATVMIDKNADNTVAVSVKLKKIDGYALNEIPLLHNDKISEEVSSIIESTHPDEYLAKKLQEKGIIHHDINKGNIIYNKGEFFMIDFDSANFIEGNNMVTDSQTESMRNKLKFVFNDLLRDIKTDYRAIRS